MLWQWAALYMDVEGTLVMTLLELHLVRSWQLNVLHSWLWSLWNSTLPPQLLLFFFDYTYRVGLTLNFDVKMIYRAIFKPKFTSYLKVAIARFSPKRCYGIKLYHRILFSATLVGPIFLIPSIKAGAFFFFLFSFFFLCVRMYKN